MKCDRCKELLSWYLESDMRPEEMEEVAEHLSVCKECAEELKLLEGTLTLARGLPQLVPPAEVCAQLLNKVRAATEPRETHYVWEEVRRKGRIETFIREPEPRYLWDRHSCLPSQARMFREAESRESGPAPRFRSWTQILKQFNGIWWSFYAEANS
jgi:anti-sigma factor RsiW